MVGQSGKITLILILLMLAGGSLSAQHRKPVAPIKKREISSRGNPADSLKKENELHLKSVTIEKQRREHLKLPPKPPAPAVRTAFVAVNPLRGNNLIGKQPAPVKYAPVKTGFLPVNSYVNLFGGNYNTLSVSAGIAVPEFRALTVEGGYYKSDGNSDYTGGTDIHFSAKAEPFVSVRIPLGISYRYRNNFEAGNGKEIFNAGRLALEGGFRRAFGELETNTVLRYDGNSLNYADSALSRSENFIFINIRTFYPAKWAKLESSLMVGYLHFSESTAGISKNEPLINFSAKARFPVGRDFNMEIGVKTYSYKWHRLESSGLLSRERRGIVPVAGININALSGIISLKYDPRVVAGNDFTEITTLDYSNSYFGGSRFNVLTDNGRVLLEYGYTGKKLNLEISSGWEKTEGVPVILADNNKTSAWWFNAGADCYFGRMKIEYRISEKISLKTSFLLQEFSQTGLYTHLPFKPGFFWKVEATGKIWRKLLLTGGFNYISGRYRAPEDNNMLPAAINLYGGVLYRPYGFLDFRLKLDNILGSDIPVTPTYSLPKTGLRLMVNYRF